MDRLGGLGGWADGEPPYSDTENVGECERPLTLSQLPLDSNPTPNEIDREALGPGI
jgi:hypothetical protein